VVGPYKLYSRPVHRYGGILQLAPGQAPTGYGAKITSDIVLQFDGETHRWRVYATCYSNAASHWILRKKVRLYLKTHFQEDILEETEP